MKIATWNLERLKQRTTRLADVGSQLHALAADILVLTETSTNIRLEGLPEVLHTTFATDIVYAKHERRVSIFSRYPVVGQVATWEASTSICPLIETPLGEVAVYGTIIGTYGNRHQNFAQQLAAQLADLQAISKKHPLIVAGDFNLSLADQYYFTHQGRTALLAAFQQANLSIVTAPLPQNIDHIALPESWLVNRSFTVGSWNEDKQLSDHKGVWVEMV